jgi:hypothetical protein
MVSVQQGWSNFLLNGAQHPDETRNVAFDGQGLQSRKNENKRKVEQACTEFAHAPAHARTGLPAQYAALLRPTKSCNFYGR